MHALLHAASCVMVLLYAPHSQLVWGIEGVWLQDGQIWSSRGQTGSRDLYLAANASDTSLGLFVPPN